jgi:hypothetical protein
MKTLCVSVAALALAGTAAAAPVRTVQFGDAFTYVAEGPVGSLAPFTAIGEPRVERTDGVVRVTYRLACLSEACLGSGPTRRVRLGTTTIVVRGRVTPAEVAAGLSAYRRNTALPAHADARSASWALAAVAGLAAVAAVAAFLLALPRRRAHVDALERAVRLLRESVRRAAPDRRRAADLLARITPDDGLADEARAVAWSRRDPAPADAEKLAARAAREVA